jgi:pimeloyl-ACP methyl ester carboxylesterase
LSAHFSFSFHPYLFSRYNKGSFPATMWGGCKNHAGGRKSALGNIPLEYFATAIDWLQAQDSVRSDKLAIVGGSRGGELALLLGATFPQINAVVAYAPSSVLWGGAGATSASCAWVYAGQNGKHSGQAESRAQEQSRGFGKAPRRLRSNAQALTLCSARDKDAGVSRHLRVDAEGLAF